MTFAGSDQSILDVSGDRGTDCAVNFDFQYKLSCFHRRCGREKGSQGNSEDCCKKRRARQVHAPMLHKVMLPRTRRSFAVQLAAGVAKGPTEIIKFPLWVKKRKSL